MHSHYYILPSLRIYKDLPHKKHLQSQIRFELNILLHAMHFEILHFSQYFILPEVLLSFRH